jgi:hypothetical protein
MSIYHASEFWDEHDFQEDAVETDELSFALIGKQYIGVDVGLYKKIQKQAQILHVPEDTLIHRWLQEKVACA